MNFKILFIFMLLIAVATPQAGAVDITTVIPGLMSSGLNIWIKSLGDQVYSAVGMNNSSEMNMFMTKVLLSNNEEFLNNNFIRELKDFNAFWYAIFYIFYVLFGAILVWLEGHQLDYSLRDSFVFIDEDLDTENYLKTCIWGLIIFMFGYYGLDYIFKIEWLITQTITLETFNLMPLTSDNAVAYFFGALLYGSLSIFFMIRYFVVGIVTGILFFLLGLYLFPHIRGVITVIFSYTFTMLFSRFFIAIAITGGFSLIQALPEGIRNTMLPYLVLLLVINFFALTFILSPFTILKWAKTGIKILI